MYTARDAAFVILNKMENDNAYSTSALSRFFQNRKIERQEVQLASVLVYGVTERRLTLDWNLSLYLTQPLKKLKPQVLTILRMGGYQLLYMDKIPVSAAVNESVKLAKNNSCAFAAGLINAVLRKIAAAGLQLPQTGNLVGDWSILYSYPEPLVRHYINAYGRENAKKIIEGTAGRSRLFIRVNTIKTNDAALLARLEKEGVEAMPAEGMPHCLALGATGDITTLPSFQQGLFHVQDYSSQCCCGILDAQAGEFLVDACAAPGGKSFTACYAMGDSGRILACDIHPFKTEQMAQAANRLGLYSIETVCADANTLHKTIRNADRVLCDAPCSGLGVTGRKPEIRYKALDEFRELPHIQLSLLHNCAEMVRPGGTLVYSTCTLNPAENEDVCDAFLAENSAFFVDSSFVPASSPTEKYRTVIPDGNGDGFFVAKFCRKGL